MSDDETGAQTGSENQLKSRDDADIVSFSLVPGATADAPRFAVQAGSRCAWAKDGGFNVEDLRRRIEPWLTALCQSEHLSLLVGSGLAHAVHNLAAGKMLPGMDVQTFGEHTKDINAAAAKAASAAGRDSGNIEDQLRIANELLRGLEILGEGEPKYLGVAVSLKTEVARVLGAFAENILLGERGIVAASQASRESAFNYLVSFLMSFASRVGTRDRLHIFTTNYDRIVEAGAEVAGLHLLDRFVGSLAPIFRSSRLDLDIHYNPPGIRGEPRYLEGVARFTKLHGSLDWIEHDRDIRRAGLPFGARSVEPYLRASGAAGADATHLMIYPNSAKDRETAEYPYVDLFRDLAAAACRPNHGLVTFGYAFGDEHINRVIGDMLTIPSSHLVVISYGDPLGRIRRFYDQVGRPAQITLLVGNHVGDLRTLVDHYLPKPAIDRTTFRMSELLKSRWGTNQGAPHETNSPPATEKAEE